MDTPARVWQKSSHSGDSSNCVYVAAAGDAVMLRESEEPDTILTVTAPVLSTLLDSVKTGRLARFRPR